MTAAETVAFWKRRRTYGLHLPERREHATKETKMVVRMAVTSILSVAVLVTVSLLASFGVLWWTGSVVTSAPVGGVCGLAAAFAVEALNTAKGRAKERPCERPSDGNERSNGGSDRQGK